MKKLSLVLSITILSVAFSSSILAQKASNPLNPYDQAGMLHNQKLNQFYGTAYPGGKSPTPESAEEGFNAIDFSGFGEAGFDLNEYLTNSSYFDTYVNSLKGSQKFNSYISAIKSRISRSDAITQLKNLEQSIMNDKKSLSTNEYVALLVGTSIARHSVDYWKNNLDDWAPTAGSVGGDIVKVDFVVGVGMAIRTGLLTGGASLGPSVAAGAGASAAVGLYHGAKWVLKQVGKNTGWWTID